jgi:hypothetical protein
MDSKKDVKRVGAKEDGSDVPKKAYAEPKLTVHGKVEDITKNFFSPGSGDGGYGSGM